MIDDNAIADDLIPGRLKRSPSYHTDYGRMTYAEIKRLASGRPADRKAQQMKKLMEDKGRLQKKLRRRER